MAPAPQASQAGRLASFTTEAIHDSDRTFIVPQRTIIASNGHENLKNRDDRNDNKTIRRSAYFADTGSESSLATAGGGVNEAFEPERKIPTTPRRLLFASGVERRSRTVGSRSSFLDKIRNSKNDGEKRDALHHGRSRVQDRSNGTKESPESRRQTSDWVGDGDEHNKVLSVFSGSIRFPASRVALWNRRATGSPVAVTPESAAPLLVVRQHAVDLLARKLRDLAADGPEKRADTSLRWRGVIGPVADILHHGRAVDDPRAVSAPSWTALEIVDVLGDRGDGSFSRGDCRGCQGGAGAVADGQSRMVSIQGDLTVDNGESQIREDIKQATLEEGYRIILESCSKNMAAARSASPAIFMPLRFTCSLKQSGHTATRSRDDLGAGQKDGRKATKVGKHRMEATLSLRAEMIVPMLEVRLTPIQPLALLHTALYQSLLTHGAEQKPQSGLLTLNEGRRAVLLSDTDPLSLRAPIVGIWVSGGTVSGTESHGSAIPPFQHPHTYPACLRFSQLHTARGARLRRKAARNTGVPNPTGASTVPASPAAFVVLQLPGGTDGSNPSFFEGTLTSPTENGSRNLVSAAGFEQLDFSANVDVVFGEEGGPGAMRGGTKGEKGKRGGGGSKSRGGSTRTVVIGRLRRVANPVFAQPFQRAQDAGRRRIETAADLIGHFPPPAAPGVKESPTTTMLTPEKAGSSSNARWHVRHHATSPDVLNRRNLESGYESGHALAAESTSMDHPRQAPAPMAPPKKPSLNATSASPASPPSTHARVLASAAPNTMTKPDPNSGRGRLTPSPPPPSKERGFSPSPPTTSPDLRGLGRAPTSSADASAPGSPPQPSFTQPSPATANAPLLSEHLDVDLRSLDPSARELLLLQQQKLSDLEAQLRKLRAQMSRQAPPTTHNRATAGIPSLDYDHHDSITMSNTQSSIRGTQQPMGRGALKQVPLPEVSEESGEGREVERDHEVRGDAWDTSRGRAAGVMVEVSTNTSFVWGPPLAEITVNPDDRGIPAAAATPVTYSDENRRASSGDQIRTARTTNATIVPNQMSVHPSVERRQNDERTPTPPLPQAPGERGTRDTDPHGDLKRSEPSAHRYQVAGNGGGWTTQKGTAVVAHTPRRTDNRSSRRGGEKNGRRDGGSPSSDRNDHRDGSDRDRAFVGEVSGSENGSFASPSIELLRLPTADIGMSRWPPSAHALQERNTREFGGSGYVVSEDADVVSGGASANVIGDRGGATNRGRQRRRCEASEMGIDDRFSPPPGDVVLTDGHVSDSESAIVDVGTAEKAFSSETTREEDDSDESYGRAADATPVRRKSSPDPVSDVEVEKAWQRRRQASVSGCESPKGVLLRVGGSVDGFTAGRGSEVRSSSVWRSTTVLPVSIASLMMVPKIEFGQLTDDELGSDFEEGETIGQIESKYLRGGTVGRRASLRVSGRARA